MRNRPHLPKKGTVVFDIIGKVTCLAAANGYVMCRRPNAMPFVMALHEWNSLHAHKKTEAEAPVFLKQEEVRT